MHFVCRRGGVCPILCEFPCDCIRGGGCEVDLGETLIKVDKLGDVFESEVPLRVYLVHPKVILKSFPRRARLPLCNAIN